MLIDPHWAVTAAHCLGEKALGHVAPPSAVHLLLGYVDGVFVRHLQPDAIRVLPQAPLDPALHRGSDVALLHFGIALPATIPLQTAPLAAGTAVQLGGYGQDRAERLAVDPACRTEGYFTDPDRLPVLLHSCNGTRGTSGGAVLVSEAGKWHLAGVQVAGRTDGAGGEAVPSATIADWWRTLR